MMRLALFAALLFVPLPPNPPERRQTIPGAYARSLDRLEIFRREYNLENQNTGLQGRTNALRQNVRQAEVPPLGVPPLHGDW